MRFSMRLAGLAVWWLMIPHSAPADTYGDLDQCRFVGGIGRADQGIAACDRALADPKLTGPGRAIVLGNRCGWWWAKRQPDRALSDCNEAIRVDPDYAAAYINRGNAYLGKADIDDAFADFNAAIRLDPKSAWAFNARGEIYKNKGDFDRALSDFGEAIRFDPNYAIAYFLRGDVYKRKGDFDHALVDLNESIRLDPNNAIAYFTRGGVLYMMGNNPGALADFTSSIRLSPDDSAAYFNRGVAYYVVGGRFADAEADFRKAAELNPHDAYAALWLDLAARRNRAPSRLPEAAKQLDMVVWPAPLIRRFLGELNTAQTLAAANDGDPKTKLGESCEANFYSGEFEMSQKNRAQALGLLRLAANNCPRGFIESTAAIAELIAQQ